MQTQRINITLPEKIIQALSFSVPLGKRSQFIADAVSEKLQKKELAQKTLKESLSKNNAFYKNIAHDWEEIEILDWPEL